MADLPDPIGLPICGDRQMNYVLLDIAAFILLSLIAMLVLETRK